MHQRDETAASQHASRRTGRVPGRGRTAAQHQTTPVGRPTVKALNHAIAVLEALTYAHRELGVSEIARRVGMSKTAAYNILSTFVEHRLVMKDERTSQYRLGWRMYELGSVLLRTTDIASVAPHHLAELAEQVRETVLLGILDDEEVLYLHRVEREYLLRLIAMPGRRAALHSTATGKVLLASLAPDHLARITGGDLQALTRRTVVDARRLHRQLERVRQRGYAICMEENEVELASVSVPIRDQMGLTVAGLTLAGPATRFNRAAIDAALPLLRATANCIGRELEPADSADE